MAKDEAETQAQAKLAKLTKLAVVRQDLLEKLALLSEEEDAILSGKATIGDKMRQVTQAFEGLWCARYAPGQTKLYAWGQAKDFGPMKTLIQKLGAEEVCARAERYLRSDDPFYVRLRHTWGGFVASINSWAGERGGLAEDTPAPTGCKHTPPCASDQIHTSKRARELREMPA